MHIRNSTRAPTRASYARVESVSIAETDIGTALVPKAGEAAPITEVSIRFA